jgi:hypothetical protein
LEILYVFPLEGARTHLHKIELLKTNFFIQVVAESLGKTFASFQVICIEGVRKEKFSFSLSKSIHETFKISQKKYYVPLHRLMIIDQYEQCKMNHNTQQYYDPYQFTVYILIKYYRKKRNKQKA